MKKSMQFLVSDVISVPVRIKVGREGAANEDVKQEVVAVHDAKEKF